MKRNILTFGLISGIILVINMVYAVYLCYTNPDFVGNDIVGYAVMIVTFSMTFFGIRNYRDKQLDGLISLGKAFKTGALIALLASTMYVVIWLFAYYLIVPDFLDKYIPHALKEAARGGASASELAEKTKDMENFRELYKNPFFVVLITYSEVLPIGLIVAFISSLILKRKAPVPATN